MNNIIKYRTFQSSEEFETWQKENPENIVCIVQPIIDEFGGNLKEDDLKIKTYDIKIFITYYINPSYNNLQ